MFNVNKTIWEVHLPPYNYQQICNAPPPQIYHWSCNIPFCAQNDKNNLDKKFRKNLLDFAPSVCFM
jgi:hypothetical protein